MGYFELWLGDYWQDVLPRSLGTATHTVVWPAGGDHDRLASESPRNFFGSHGICAPVAGSGFRGGVFMWRELRKSPLPERPPAAFLTLVEFLMTHMDSPRLHHESVVEAAEMSRQNWQNRSSRLREEWAIG
jgi:hypothetical protein